jgi:hypothetical protein
LASGERPAAVGDVRDTRTTPLDADVSWNAVAGAHAYNLRYGLEGKLYHSMLIHDATSVSIGALNLGFDYWVAVDSVNACGVTRGAAQPIR